LTAPRADGLAPMDDWMPHQDIQEFLNIPEQQETPKAK
jgi:hypothetical protein